MEPHRHFFAFLKSNHQICTKNLDLSLLLKAVNSLIFVSSHTKAWWMQSAFFLLLERKAFGRERKQGLN